MAFAIHSIPINGAQTIDALIFEAVTGKEVQAGDVVTLSNGVPVRTVSVDNGGVVPVATGYPVKE